MSDPSASGSPPSYSGSGGHKRARPRLLATDLDGTLLRSDNTVSDATRDALAAAAEQGLDVVFVTGRPTRWLWEVSDATGYTGVVVAANGAMAFDLATETVLHETPLDETTLAAVTAALRDNFDDVFFAVDFGQEFAHEPGYKHDWEITTIRDRHGNPMPYPQAQHLSELVARPALKLLAKIQGADPDRFLVDAAELIGDRAYVTRSATSGLLEISAAGVSKAAGLARHCELVGVAPEEVAAVGDMPNDIPMLDWAGHSYAVANAHESTKAAADEVLEETNDQDAVARLILQLLAQ